MLGLPAKTEYNHKIPKKTFYSKLSVTSAMKRIFVERIEGIYWRNKIAPDTMNLTPGKTVTEIEVIEVKLTAPQLDESVLKLMDKDIPYHILFLLEHDGRYQAWMAFKQQDASGKRAFKVATYYHTQWIPEKDLKLEVKGLTTDAVYENFVRQIAGDALLSENPKPLNEDVDRDLQKQKLQKRIAALETRMYKEKQFNKQVKMNEQLRQLKKKLELLD